MFNIGFTTSALEDVAWFHKREQTLIFDMVQEQLPHQPHVQTRNRKRLRPNRVAEWELRIDKYRVFCDVNTATETVEIKMVGYKEGNRLLVRGKEYPL